MTSKENIECILEEMFANASREYRSGAEYEFLREKLERRQSDCKYNLSADAMPFAEDCFEILLESAAHEGFFIYKRGIRDGVEILKKMGILA